MQVGDMGVDGGIVPGGTEPADTHGLYDEDWFPIQLKPVDKVGRPDIDQFEVSWSADKGEVIRSYFVSFHYSRDVEQECAAFLWRPGRIVKLFTVQEILDEEHVQKM